MVCNCHRNKILLFFLQTQSIKKSLMKNGSTYDQLCFFSATTYTVRAAHFLSLNFFLQLTKLSFEWKRQSKLVAGTWQQFCGKHSWEIIEAFLFCSTVFVILNKIFSVFFLPRTNLLSVIFRS